jgi:hypothetical protein
MAQREVWFQLQLVGWQAEAFTKLIGPVHPGLFERTPRGFVDGVHGSGFFFREIRRVRCPFVVPRRLVRYMSSYDMNDLLTLVTTDQAEGLSLHSGQMPVVRLGGEPHPIEGPAITIENAEMLLGSLATTRQVRELRERGTYEFIYTFRESTRFRVRAWMQDDQLQLDLQRLDA